jgi:DNA-binding CsgD family transcriptional regulator
VVATLAVAAGQAGDAATAAEALAWIDDHPAFPVGPDTLGLDLGRVWLHAARGETSTARALALAVAARAQATGCGLLEVTALVDAARLGAAAEAADRLAELSARLAGPFLAAASGFARALAAGDGTGLDLAADGFAAAGARLLAAESATAAAEAHEVAGRRRPAAAARARALRWAGECDGAATPLLRRLAQEPPAAALTRREREVAELAARGRSNREIADALHVSRRTVDSHLDHAYTKLGITTRRELAPALGLTPAPA